MKNPYGLSVRIPADLARAAEEIAVQMNYGEEGRAKVIRQALERGLDVLRAECFQVSPHILTSGFYRLHPRFDADFINWWLRAPIVAWEDQRAGRPPPLTPEEISQMSTNRNSIDMDGHRADAFFRWAVQVSGWPAFGPKPIAAQRIA